MARNAATNSDIEAYNRRLAYCVLRQMEIDPNFTNFLRTDQTHCPSPKIARDRNKLTSHTVLDSILTRSSSIL